MHDLVHNAETNKLELVTLAEKEAAARTEATAAARASQMEQQRIDQSRQAELDMLRQRAALSQVTRENIESAATIETLREQVLKLHAQIEWLVAQQHLERQVEF